MGRGVGFYGSDINPTNSLSVVDMFSSSGVAIWDFCCGYFRRDSLWGS